MSVKVAVIQAPPVLLDRAATISGMLRHIAEVAAAGAKLVIFPEAYIPGYPTWVWRLKPGADMALAGDIHSRLREQSVDIARGDLRPLTEAAASLGLTVVWPTRTGFRIQRHNAFQHGSRDRSGRHNSQSTPKVTAHQSRAHDLGTRRRSRPARHRDTGRTRRLPDLLGKLHAACALRVVCSESRNSRRADVGLR
jgi:hypothetical protein